VIFLSSKDRFQQSIEKVEEFIKRLRNLDIEIDDKKARQIYFNIGKSAKRTNLADILASKIDNYNMQENDNLRKLATMMLVEWIDKAYINNVIKDGKALARKLKECIEQKTELQNAVDTLSERNLQLEHENVDLSARLEELNKVHKVFRERNK
jgi:hypothetical protein